MQVILREKIRRLGNLGESVNVKPGFARNFLVPQGKAMMATKENIARFEAERAELEKKAAAILATAKARAEKINGLAVVIKTSAGEAGKLFGSIGTRDIAEAMTAKGIEIEKHEIRLPHGAIRLLGEYEIEIHLHGDVDAVIKLSVVPQEGTVLSVTREAFGEELKNTEEEASDETSEENTEA